MTDTPDSKRSLAELVALPPFELVDYLNERKWRIVRWGQAFAGGWSCNLKAVNAGAYFYTFSEGYWGYGKTAPEALHAAVTALVGVYPDVLDSTAPGGEPEYEDAGLDAALAPAKKERV